MLVRMPCLTQYHVTAKKTLKDGIDKPGSVTEKKIQDAETTLEVNRMMLDISKFFGNNNESAKKDQKKGGGGEKGPDEKQPSKNAVFLY